MLDVIIVNWNAGTQLHECVDSVIQHRQPLLGQIVVIDNGSTDGSETAIEGLPKIILIRAGDNLGFGKACNLGASHTSREFLLFLNPDTRLFPDTLASALGFMQKPENAKVGICGVQLIDEEGHVARSCARFPTASGFVAHAVGLDRVFRSLGHFMGDWDHADTRRVDQVIGEHGVNGYLAKDSDGWLAALLALCMDASLRQRMGAQGRAAVEQKYCLQVTAPRLAKLFHEVAAREIT